MRWEPSQDDLTKMRHVARKKACVLARGHDDIEEAAQDIEQDGWETFLITKRLLPDADSNHLWFRAFSRMTAKYFKFRCGSRFGVKNIPNQTPDFSHLRSHDPSIEEQVLGCELMRHFETELGKMRKSDKTRELLETMILNGEPYNKRNPFKRGDEPRRRQRLKQILQKLVVEK
jgi:hypothetical protein